MQTIEYILLAIALGIPLMIELRRSSEASNIKSIRGLGISVAVSALQVALILGGLYLGKALRFEPTELCGTIALALLVVVAVKMFITSLSKKERPSYDLSKTATVLTLGIALGINTFITGLGLGMSTDNINRSALTTSISIAVCSLFFSEIGIMLGRQKKALRERRHSMVALLLYLAAIAWHVAF